MLTTTKLRHALMALSLCTITCASHALEFSYSGSFNLCSATCDSFDALGSANGGSQNQTNSTVQGSIDLPAMVGSSFAFTVNDDVPFDFVLANNAVVMELPVIGPNAGCPPPNLPGQICNVATSNPLPLNNAVATVSGSGEIGANGTPQSGTLIFRWRAGPLSTNGIELHIDLATGGGEATLFGGVITFFAFDGEFSPNDTDGDGIADSSDNCLTQPNTPQRDTDGDGYGNRCDADLDNNCIVNVVDLGILRSVFFTGNANADLNGDQFVNFIDLGILRTSFFRPPGPSAQSEVCTTP